MKQEDFPLSEVVNELDQNNLRIMKETLNLLYKIMNDPDQSYNDRLKATEAFDKTLNFFDDLIVLLNYQFAPVKL